MTSGGPGPSSLRRASRSRSSEAPRGSAGDLPPVLCGTPTTTVPRSGAPGAPPSPAIKRVAGPTGRRPSGAGGGGHGRPDAVAVGPRVRGGAGGPGGGDAARGPTPPRRRDRLGPRRPLQGRNGDDEEEGGAGRPDTGPSGPSVRARGPRGRSATAKGLRRHRGVCGEAGPCPVGPVDDSSPRV